MGYFLLMICIISTTQVTAASGTEDNLKHAGFQTFKDSAGRAQSTTAGAGNQPTVNSHNPTQHLLHTGQAPAKITTALFPSHGAETKKYSPQLVVLMINKRG